MAQGNRIKIFQGRDPHTKFSANPLSLYHYEGCSYSYSSVRGSDTRRFPLSLLYHSSITSEIWSFLYMIKNQCTILFLFLKKHIKESNKQM